MDNRAALSSVSDAEQPGFLRSTGITPLHRYYEPLRLLPRPTTVFGFGLMRSGCGPLPPHRDRSPELRSHSLTTCRPDYPAAAPGLHAPVASSEGGCLRPMHKGSACGAIVIEAHMGSLVLRPAVSPPPHPSRSRRLNPANLNAPVARSRPAGRYTLNRQLAWKAPFILQDRERLGSAYAHLDEATTNPIVGWVLVHQSLRPCHVGLFRKGT